MTSGHRGRASDLACGRGSLLLWWLPAAAVLGSLDRPAIRPWLWIPALTVMGVACIVNAAQCGRVHCYVSGPVFLLAAAYSVLGAMGLAPPRPTLVLDTVLVLVALARCLEWPLGRYRPRV